MTQSELHLCRIWAREESLGDWWRCWSTLSDVSAALIWAGASEDMWRLYEDASLLAIARANLAGEAGVMLSLDEAVAELERIVAGQREAA